jgi:phthalate 4,5-dioxygenase oxygenase subunit
VQESMGPNTDRTRERLGTSDTAIIATRRLLIDEIRALAAGQEPFAPAHGDIYWVRSASMVMKREVDFADGARHLMQGSV